MFGRKKEQPSLGEMLKSSEAPQPMESRQEMSFDNWDQRAAAKGEWAANKASEVKEKAKQLWGGLKGRMKKGVGWAMTAPEMAAHAAGRAKDAVSERMVDAGNVDYDRNQRLDGGRVENFLASLDDKREQIKDGMVSRYESSRDTAQDNFKQFKEGFLEGLQENKDEVVKMGQEIQAASLYIANRTEQAYDRFRAFLKYNSPAQRRSRATRAAERQVKSLQTEKAVTNMSAKDLMALLNSCEKYGVNVDKIKVEIGFNNSEANVDRRSEMPIAA